MAVPKKRTTSARRDRRRGHIFIKEPTLVTCKKCGSLILPHTVCKECGFYKEKEYIDVMKKDKTVEVSKTPVKEKKESKTK